MKKTNKFDAKMLVSVSVGAIVYLAVGLMLSLHESECVPETAIGTEGLKQVRRYLGAEMLSVYAGAASLLPAAFVGSAVYKLGRRDKSADKLFFSPAAVIVSAVFAVIVLLRLPVKNCWDIQTELNGYKGLRIMKLTSLYMDCGRDLKEQSARELTGDGFTVAYHIHSYTVNSGRGSSRHVRIHEFALEKDGAEAAQVTNKDYLELKDKLWKNDEHAVRLFAHSGLICELDGSTEDFASDYENMFTLTYENEHLVRSTRSDEWELGHLYLMEIKDGKVIAQINMKNNTDQYMPAMTDLNYGHGIPNLVPVDRRGQTAYLEAVVDGKARRVSNTVKFGIGGIIDE
ncbi:hypothetical protein [uncultured Ruminococcus sp.]|uniref:hypothetical protein n=1 Tax=uncultured Ruminococcus sp. TaxID=165186 RepID=UPI000EC21A59|nr:hypothetical protein [uncultured Ruminococcus sp.]HCJ42319.1 hypothetical protein [Ruminococcus sp.]